jgi:Tfp pilus assembly protein PilF
MPYIVKAINQLRCRSSRMSRFLQTFSLPLVFGLLLLAGHSSQAQGASGDYYENARQRFDAGDIAGALIQLKNALQVDPQHVPSLVLSGEVYL